MQHQIVQYTRMMTAFANLSEPTSSQLEEDDSKLDQYSSDTDDDSISRGLFFRVNSRRAEVVHVMRKAFSDCVLSSWNELPLDIDDACWNLMWVWGLPKAADFDNLLVFQKINRFRNTRGLTRKDLLKKNIQRCSGTDIMPLTYALPHEFNSFVSGYQSIQKVCGNKAANIWIIKPVGLSRGRGISLVNDIADVSYSQPIVIQRYISDPLCFMGFKFDLRVYVLVTSFNPLEAFIYKEGLARFGTRQYSLRAEFLKDNRIQLAVETTGRSWIGHGQVVAANSQRLS
jgi:tubulin polyglutamylase TTLL5